MDLSVREAARELDLDPSRVRQLARSGALRARRVGTVWLIDGDAVAQRGRAHVAPGRPLSAARAWGAVALLAGGRPEHLSASARGQVRALLTRRVGATADDWSALMRNLAQVHDLRVHPSVLSLLLDSPDVGDAALPAEPLGLVISDPVPRLYAGAGAWASLAADAGVDLVEPSGPQRLRVFVVPDLAGAVLAADRGREVASIVLATGDDEPRTRDAAAAALNRLATRAGLGARRPSS